MPQAAAQEADFVAIPTPERLIKGDIVVTGKGKAARARVLSVVAHMDSDCKLAAAWILSRVEAAQYSGYRLSRFERHGSGGNVELLPAARAEAARKALHRMWGRLPAELALVIEYRLAYNESEQDTGIRLGLSRGQVSRRFEAGLRAVSRVLKGGDRRSWW